MRRFFGLIVFLLGILLSAWIAYNLFVELQPAAAGRNPIPGIFLAIGLLFVGVSWMRGRSAG